VVDQYASGDAQQRTGEDRDRDHESFLARVKSKISGDLNSERTQKDPNHEGHIEVEEGSEESWCVSSFKKFFANHEIPSNNSARVNLHHRWPHQMAIV
jgi:hypothetical protein